MSIKNNIQKLEQAIAASAASYHRKADSIRLLAVSKNQSLAKIQEAIEAGLSDFAESYWQEALPKINALEQQRLSWHFIGPIQSNKAPAIAKKVNWVHSIDREKTLRLLSLARPLQMSPLNLCIQVNLDNEKAKTGLALSDEKSIIALALLIKTLPGLRLRGLMAIPKPEKDAQKQYQSLFRLTALLQELNQHYHLKLDTLSMGMSEDFDAAIAAGSTILRIGRKIFNENKTILEK